MDVPRTHIILDGLQDPVLGQRLSVEWMAAGFANAVDISGQAAWLSMDGRPLTEEQMEGASAIARRFGLEVRDRAGAAYHAENSLETLRAQAAREWRMRSAQAVMFGLPALVLHYMAPVLAGARRDARGMFYPWVFELLLVGWATLAGAWPILWQGALSLRWLRGTADLLTSVVMLAAFVPSVVDTLMLPITGHAWFGERGPMFHAAALTVLVASLARWAVHAHAARLAGRATLMIPHFGRLIALWLVAMGISAGLAGWGPALALGLIMPPALSVGAVNRWSPGVSMALPVVAFALLLTLGPRPLGMHIAGVEVETAAGFALLMTGVFVLGWRGVDKK